MERSESIAKLAEALAKAQTEIGIAAFDSKNPHFNSKYASLAAVAEAAKPLAAHGIAVLQPASTRRDEKGVMVIVKTILAHSSGEWIADEIAMKPAQDTPQAIGSALTYGRRYLLASFVGIASDEDDDGNAASGQKPTPRPAPKPAPKSEPSCACGSPLTAGIVHHSSGCHPASVAKPKHTVELPPEEKPAPAAEAKQEAPRLPAQVGKRNAAIREIFTLSTKKGMDPIAMFKEIKTVVQRDVKESKDLSDAEIEKVLAHFRAGAEPQEVAV